MFTYPWEECSARMSVLHSNSEPPANFSFSFYQKDREGLIAPFSVLSLEISAQYWSSPLMVFTFAKDAKDAFYCST